MHGGTVPVVNMDKWVRGHYLQSCDYPNIPWASDLSRVYFFVFYWARDACLSDILPCSELAPPVPALIAPSLDRAPSFVIPDTSPTSNEWSALLAKIGCSRKSRACVKLSVIESNGVSSTLFCSWSRHHLLNMAGKTRRVRGRGRVIGCKAVTASSR